MGVRTTVSGAAALLVAVFGWPRVLAAQTDVEELGRVHGARPPTTYYDLLRRVPNAFQFSPDNGWIRRAQAVAARRAAWRPVAGAQAEPAPQAYVQDGVLTGELRVPVFLILFANTDSSATVTNLPRDSMEARLYGTQAAPPYTVPTYYQEISDDRLSVSGTVLEWRRVSLADTVYEGGCNGLCGSGRMAQLLSENVQAWDGELDFGQFDNDGPDGVPNSWDDDGFVDAVVLIHPELDGACGTTNIWAHKATYGFWTGGSDLSTKDGAAAGGKIKIRDYIVQGGQGGEGGDRPGCEADKPTAPGLVTHETGHLFGLPDLYNTNRNRLSQGIGHWGIMGSGNWNQPTTPAHMEAWSRARLGWVTEVLIARDTTLEISPVATADTAFIVPIRGTNEYFLLENRQRIGSDLALHAPGLLIWQVDSVLVRQRDLPLNTINAADPEAVRLVQADGRGDLQAGRNRGDEGDAFPGVRNNREFGLGTSPTSDRNDGAPSYVVIDSIKQVTPDGALRVRIRFLTPSLIAANDTLARFRLDSVAYGRFEGVLKDSTEHTLEMDSVQLANQGRNRYTWLEWSNGQPRSHTFTASADGDTILATVSTEFLVTVMVNGSGGTVTSHPAGDVEAGIFVRKDSTVTLIATVTEPGHVFEGWDGDRTSKADTLVLKMIRPWQLRATFARQLAMDSTATPSAIVGVAYQHSFTATGGIGTYQWGVAGGTVPRGLSLGSNGVLAGRAAESGDFAFDLSVTSGSQTASRRVQLTVGVPQLAAADIAAQILGVASPLSGDAVSYLDFIGNRNTRLDLGDFLAWLEQAARDQP